MAFDKLTKFLNSIADVYDVPACDCAVTYNHENVYREMFGYSDFNKTKKVSDKDLYFLYSASKLITCTCAVMLIEQGKIALDDEAWIYLPELKDMKIQTKDGIVKAKNKITIKDLFTMCGGFTYNLTTDNILNEIKRTNNMATTRQMLSAIAKDPLIFEPGTCYNYSLCHDFLGGIIEVVSGMKFGEYLKKYITEPLEMKNTGFNLTDEVKSKLSAQYKYDNDTKKSVQMPAENCFILSENYESGGAGIISCVNDYITFVDALANDGVAKNSYRVLKKESIDLMRQNHLSEECHKYFIKPGYGYGLGVRTLIDKSFGAKSAIGEFGWDGAAGAYAMIDPKNHISVFYAMHVRECGVAYSEIHPTIRDLVYECLGL